MDIQFLLSSTFQVFILPLLTAAFGIVVKTKAFDKSDKSRTRLDKFFIGFELAVVACATLAISIIIKLPPFIQDNVISIPFERFKKELLPPLVAISGFILVIILSVRLVRKFGWRKRAHDYTPKFWTVFLVDLIGIGYLITTNLLITAK